MMCALTRRDRTGFAAGNDDPRVLVRFLHGVLDLLALQLDTRYQLGAETAGNRQFGASKILCTIRNKIL
jgi:hypothetical protein